MCKRLGNKCVLRCVWKFMMEWCIKDVKILGIAPECFCCCCVIPSVYMLPSTDVHYKRHDKRFWSGWQSGPSIPYPLPPSDARGNAAPSSQTGRDDPREQSRSSRFWTRVVDEQSLDMAETSKWESLDAAETERRHEGNRQDLSCELWEPDRLDWKELGRKTI